MSSRHRLISRPTLKLLKSTITTSTPKSIPSLWSTLSSPSLRRSVPQLGSLQSLLPLHTATSLLPGSHRTSASIRKVRGPYLRN